MLELVDIRKVYGVSRVLDHVDLTVRAGEVHGVVGENGAGKSTLMKIAAGLVRPDCGNVLVDDKPLQRFTPRAALSLGIGIATQELTSVPARTVIENVFLGMSITPVGDIRHGWTARRFREICERTGFRLPATALVRELSLAEQQILEILRCLIREPRVLILDEPTSSLDESGAAQLCSLLRDLRKSGVAVLFISHHLNEVLQTADRITVLRDGKVVSTGLASDETEASLVRKMVGRPVQVANRKSRRPAGNAEVVLEANDLWWENRVRGVSLQVRRGEVVGLAGLVGAGRSEFARCLIGAVRPDRGTVRIAGWPAVRPRRVREMIEAGLVMVPEDRKTQGLVLSRSVAENIALVGARATVGRVIALPSQLEAAAASWVRRADIRPASPGTLVGRLSGGNQQKVLLAKWLACDPKVIIADEPTRGVDVAAKIAIHEMLSGAAESGMGVLLISSELEELIALAHRIVVFRKGVVVGEFDGDPGRREEIIAAAFGAVA